MNDKINMDSTLPVNARIFYK